MTTKKYLLLGILLAMTLMLANGVYALAISSPYWPDNPLRIYPGQTVDFQLVLKNSASTEGVVVDAIITQGTDVAAITDTSKRYDVPAGGEATINVRVSVPADSAIGGNYPVKFSFKTVTSGNQNGAVGIGSAIDTSLPVFVVEKPKPVSSAGMSTVWYWVIAIVVVLVLIWIVSRRSSRRR